MLMFEKYVKEETRELTGGWLEEFSEEHQTSISGPEAPPQWH